MSTHPGVLSIIQKRDEASKNLFLNYNPYQALNILNGVIRDLEPKDRPEELQNTIIKEIEILRKMENRNQRNFRESQMKYKYEGYYEEINKILWDEGYLDNDKYRGPERRTSKIPFKKEK